MRTHWLASAPNTTYTGFLWFGSVVKGMNRPDSDVDLLVEFEPEASPSLFDMVTMEGELSDLLGGRRVDLRTPKELSRYFRDEVVRQAEVQYVSALKTIQLSELS